MWVLFLFYSLVLVVGGFFDGALMTGALLAAASAVTWTRLPRWFRRIVTWPLFAVITDLSLAYFGWAIVPDSTHAKVAFVAWHLWVSLGLIYEFHRLRDSLPFSGFFARLQKRASGSESHDLAPDGSAVAL